MRCDKGKSSTGTRVAKQNWMCHLPEITRFTRAHVPVWPRREPMVAGSPMAERRSEQGQVPAPSHPATGSHPAAAGPAPQWSLMGTLLGSLRPAEHRHHRATPARAGVRVSLFSPPAPSLCISEQHGMARLSALQGVVSSSGTPTVRCCH